MSKGKVKKVPLDRMLLIDVPFKTVDVDVISPLHSTTDMFALVYYATSFP